MLKARGRRRVGTGVHMSPGRPVGMWPDRHAGVRASEGCVMSRVRSVADWFSVRDPGWGRAQMGWRTLVGLVAGLAAGYFVAPALGLPALLGLVFGGLLGL